MHAGLLGGRCIGRRCRAALCGAVFARGGKNITFVSCTDGWCLRWCAVNFFVVAIFLLFSIIFYYFLFLSFFFCFFFPILEWCKFIRVNPFYDLVKTINDLSGFFPVMFPNAVFIVSITIAIAWRSYWWYSRLKVLYCISSCICILAKIKISFLPPSFSFPINRIVRNELQLLSVRELLHPLTLCILY